MDPSDLLPGLCKMLEQRFGATGYYMGNVVLVAASAVIVLLPVGATLLMLPRIAEAGSVFGITPASLGKTLMIFGVGAFIYLGTCFLLLQFFVTRARRIIKRDKEAADLQYRSYMADLNAIAADLRQHGITLKTVPVDTDEEMGKRED